MANEVLCGIKMVEEEKCSHCSIGILKQIDPNTKICSHCGAMYYRGRFGKDEKM